MIRRLQFVYRKIKTSRNILWILCIDRARGKKYIFYVLCVSPGWEVSILSINVCLSFMNNLMRYVTNLVLECCLVELYYIELCSCFFYIVLYIYIFGALWFHLVVLRLEKTKVVGFPTLSRRLKQFSMQYLMLSLWIWRNGYIIVKKGKLNLLLLLQKLGGSLGQDRTSPKLGLTTPVAWMNVVGVHVPSRSAAQFAIPAAQYLPRPKVLIKIFLGCPNFEGG